jgi:FAD binding domain
VRQSHEISAIFLGAQENREAASRSHAEKLGTRHQMHKDYANLSPSQSHHADVAIAGGGMAGMTLALALAQGGLRIAVADPLTPEQMADTGFDGRVSALAFANVRMLRTLGVWRRIERPADQRYPRQ